MENVSVIKSYVADLGDPIVGVSTLRVRSISDDEHTDEVFVWKTNGWCDDWAVNIAAWMDAKNVRGLPDLTKSEIGGGLIIVATPDNSADEVTLSWMRNTRVVIMNYNPATIANGIPDSLLDAVCAHMISSKYEFRLVVRDGSHHFHHHIGGSALYGPMIPVLMSKPKRLFDKILSSDVIKKYQFWGTREHPLEVPQKGDVKYLLFDESEIGSFHIEPLINALDDGCHAGIGSIKDKTAAGVKIWREPAAAD